ncbi:hypothetical protein BGW42_001727 [Actinomortierella wolfii]|nr:hypothetical protein BGW42_001727 [Actinomortierella wolfii]
MEDPSQARDELVSLARAVIDTLSSAKATRPSTTVSLASSPQEHLSEQQQEHWGQLPAGAKQQEDTYTFNQEALARLQELVSKATAVIDKYDSQHHHHHRRISLSSVSSHEHAIALTTTTTTAPAAPASLMLSPEATPVTSPVLTAYPSAQSSPPTQPQPRKTSKKMPGSFLKRTRSRSATQPLLSSSSSLSVDHTSIPENNTAQLPLSPPSSPPMNSTSTTSTWTPLPAAAMAAPATSAAADKGSSSNPVKKNRRKSLLSGISPSSLFQRLTNNSNRHSWAAPASTVNEQDATHNPRDYLDDDSENGGFDDEDSSSSSDDDDEEEEEDDDDSGESEEDESDSDDEYVSSLPSQAAIVRQQYQQRVEQQQQQQRSAERQRDQYPRRRSDAVVSFAADVEHHDAPPPSYETATTAAMTPTRYLRSYSYSSSPAAALPLRRRLPLLIQLLIQFESYILDSFKTAEFLGPCNNGNGVEEMAGARISALSNSSSSSSNSSSSLASLSSAFKRSKSFSKPKPKKTVTISTTTNRDLWLKRQPETISSFANWLIDLEQTGLLPQAMSTSWRARSNRRSNSTSSNSNDSQRATTSPPASPTTMTHDNTMLTNNRITASPPMSPTRPATAFSLGGLQYETQESWLQRTCMSLSEIDLAYAMLALEQHCVYGVDAARWSRSSSSHRGDIAPRVVWRQTLQSLIPIA